MLNIPNLLLGLPKVEISNHKKNPINENLNPTDVGVSVCCQSPVEGGDSLRAESKVSNDHDPPTGTLRHFLYIQCTLNLKLLSDIKMTSEHVIVQRLVDVCTKKNYQILWYLDAEVKTLNQI